MIRNLMILLFLASIAISSVLYRNDLKLNNAHPKLNKFELAIYRAELEFKMTRDPKTNSIPKGIKEKENLFVKNLPNSKDFYKFDKYGYPIIQSNIWKSMGPNNIAGRIKDIEFDITNENRLICASASGGIWVSEDLGENWRKTNSPMSEQTAYCIEQDRRQGNTNVWYYGSGELLSTTNRQFSIEERTVGMGNGIYKSTDNGVNWVLLPSTKVLDNSKLNDAFQGIWDIKVDQLNTALDVVYAACYGGIMMSTNAGITWNLNLGDLDNPCFSSDIDISSTGIYYASISAYTLSTVKSSKRGVYRSKDGKSWKDITPQGFPEDTRVIKIQSAPSNGNILYVVTESARNNPDPFFDFASSYHTFWKYTYNPTEDRGTWEERTANLPFQDYTNMNQSLQSGFNSLGGYCFTLNVKPDNENMVFLGGTNLFRSEDGFATTDYKRIGGYSKGVHPDQHALTFKPSNPNILYNGSDGGVTITQNCANSNVNWSEKNYGLITSQFYSIALDHKTAGDEVFVGGLQDQGTIMKNNTSANAWEQIYGGDGLSCYIANNKDFVIVSLYNGVIYGGDYYNGYFNVEQSKLILSDELYEATINFFTIFDVEPNNNDELYLAVNNSIYRKKFLKETIYNPNSRNLNWQKLNGSILPNGVNISAIEISKNPENRLYFGTDNGKLYRIDDADQNNPTKIDITDDEFPEGAYISSIVANPQNADKILVTFSNYNVQSIFYSTDGGGIWTKQGGNLEENPDGTGAGPSIRTIEILHKDGETVYYAGTSSGLYSTKSLSGVNTVWVNESTDLIGNIKIDMITARQIDGYVLVATQGNGVYACNTATNVYHDIEESINVSIYPNPVLNEMNFSCNVHIPGLYELIIYDFKGERIGTISKKYYNEGKHNISYNTIGLNSGTYFYIFKCDNLSSKGKFVILK